MWFENRQDISWQVSAGVLSNTHTSDSQPFNLHPEKLFEGGICDFSGFSEPEFFQGGHLSFFSDLWYKSSFFEGRDLEQNLDLQNLKIF